MSLLAAVLAGAFQLGARLDPASRAFAAGVPAASGTIGAAERAARTNLSESAWVTRTLAHMSLRQEVGQLFEINGYGQSIRDKKPAMVALNRRYYGVDNIEQLIRKYHPGRIIYFSWTNNVQNPPQIVGLSNGIQRVSLRQRTPVPMLISTDQEQGEVLRVGPPATVFPGNMALGATRDIGSARQAASITGVELRAMGINVDNAPVVDVNINPLNQADGVRAYGDRVRFVSRFATAQVKAYQTRQSSKGVGATAKHWPGLGDTTTNSDTGVAVSPQTLAQLRRTNFPSFKAAIRAGVDRIMATHVLFPRISRSRFPTSLSPFFVRGLLRGSLHYNGVVITDALDAGALKGFPAKQVALKALRAGDDQLLEIAQDVQGGVVDPAPANLVSAYKAVLNAVRTGSLSKRRLDRSVTRILELKWRLGLVRHPITNPERVHTVVGTPRHLAVAQRVTERSITLIRNSAKLLPLPARSGKKVLVTGLNTSTIGQDVRARGLSTQVLDTGISPTPATIASAVAAANANDIVVVAIFNGWSFPGQVNLVRGLLATGKPVAVLAVGTPYDVAYLPGASTFVSGYDFQDVSLHALVRVLFGEVKPTGKLPVTITLPPPSRTVLYPFGYRLGVP
jgi:beta-N-acetylhexosaminidase